MTLVRFRAPIPGPEYALEAAVAAHIPPTLAPDADHAWLAASAPIGAGRPDLLIVSYLPQLHALKGSGSITPFILSYLFCYSRATLPELIHGLKKQPSKIVSVLAGLINAQAVTETRRGYRLSPSWRRILTDITAIEVKMTDWKAAARQAARNRVLAHRSYIALPPKIADRAIHDPFVMKFGLGVVEVSAPEHVRVIRRSKRGVPSVPQYYFAIASLIAG